MRVKPRSGRRALHALACNALFVLANISPGFGEPTVVRRTASRDIGRHWRAVGSHMWRALDEARATEPAGVKYNGARRTA